MMQILVACLLLALVAFSESSSSSTSSSSSHNGRRLHAEENRIEKKIRAQLLAFNKANDPKELIKRQAYQARFSRTQIGLNTTFARAEGRTIGPVLLVAKTSTREILSDSFDGDVDGQDDVRFAYDQWANDRGLQEATLSGFLKQIRNRATVNGGSIDLRALVVSGRNAAGVFVKFDISTILITPCFPVTTEKDYNFEFFAGGIQASAGPTLLRSPVIFGSQLRDANGRWLESLSADTAGNAFTLRRTSGTIPAVAANPTAMPPVVAVPASPLPNFNSFIEATFVLQQCSQFGYFN